MNDVVRKKAVPNALKAFAVCCKVKLFIYYLEVAKFGDFNILNLFSDLEPSRCLVSLAEEKGSRSRSRFG